MNKPLQREPAAFDSIAEGYDAEFTASALGRVLRPMVWERFAACFAHRSSLLELGCGTGEDASTWRSRVTEYWPPMLQLK